METSFMYQALGIREQECSRVRYEGEKIILAIRTREDKLYILFIVFCFYVNGTNPSAKIRIISQSAKINGRQ